MTNEGLFAALAVSAASIGALHSLAPDHWVPLAAVARARGWSAVKTARVTLLCGLGHVTVSVALGLLGLVAGSKLLVEVGQRMEAVAGVALIAFGLLYAAWGMRGAAQRRMHGHGHSHAHSHGGSEFEHEHHGEEAGAVHVEIGHHHGHSHAHIHDPSRLTATTLFLLYSADPCVAVVPLLFAAAPLGTARTIAVVGAYELSTVGAMVSLVMIARAGATRVRGAFFDRWGDGFAGGLIAAVGLAMLVFGI